MTTELSLIGLKCQTVFNNWLGSFPVKWDDSTHQFIFKRHPRELKWYYFHIFFLICFFNGGCVIEMVLNRILYPRADFTITQYAVYGIGFVLIEIQGGFAIGLALDGQQLITALNMLILHLRHLRGGRKHFKKGAIKRNPKWTGKLKELLTGEDGSLDMMGISMMYFAAFSLWFPPFGAVLCLGLIDTNPMKEAFNDIFTPKVMSKVSVAIPAFFFYVAMFVGNIAQGIRFIQVIVIIAVVPTQIYIRITSELRQAFEGAQKVKEFEKVHLEYMKFKLVNIFISPIVQKQAFVMMQVAKWFCVYCIFIALKLNKYVDPLLIAVHVVAAWALASILGLSIPYVSKTSEVSIEAIKVWNDQVALRSQYLRTKYKALTPIMFYGGLPGIRFFAFDQSTTSDFFTSIVDTVIDLLVGYPDEDIKSFFKSLNSIR